MSDYMESFYSNHGHHPPPDRPTDSQLPTRSTLSGGEDGVIRANRSSSCARNNSVRISPTWSRDYDVVSCSGLPSSSVPAITAPPPLSSASLASEIDRLKTPASRPLRDGLGPHPIFSLVYLTPLPRSHLFRMMHLPWIHSASILVPCRCLALWVLKRIGADHVVPSTGHVRVSGGSPSDLS